jgi:hypothetical protein
MTLSNPLIAPHRAASHLGNIALVPVSLLPFRVEWQAIDDRLEPGSVLFVIPDRETTLKVGMRRIACQLRGRWSTDHLHHRKPLPAHMLTGFRAACRISACVTECENEAPACLRRRP